MNNLRVIQFEGLAPSVFCGLFFADQGAETIFVARSEAAPVSIPFDANILNRNKKCIQINFKNAEQFKLLKELIKTADIVIDPFRPGVLQKLKLGPKDLSEINKRIILLRVSGYGQTGQNKLRPGHDLNYAAVSGIIPLINKNEQYQFPSNYLADFVSASLGITGVLGALNQRRITGEGAVVDCSLANGCTYLAQPMIQINSALSSASEKVRTFKVDGKEYIATGHSVDKMKQPEMVALLDGKESYREQSGTFQLSEVKGIDPLDPKTLKNPFSADILQNSLRSKGENKEQIFAQIRAKL